MKFINPKDKRVYGIEYENGVYKVTIDDQRKGKESYKVFDQIKFDPDIDTVRERLRTFAYENGLIPLIAYNIQNSDKLVFQGEVAQHKAFVSIPDEKLNEYLMQHYELVEDNIQLQSLMDEGVKALKSQYKSKMDINAEELRKLKPIITDQAEQITVDASWERDVENELMLLIDRESMQCLKYRDMEPDEKQDNTLFDNDGKENEGEADNEGPADKADDQDGSDDPGQE